MADGKLINFDNPLQEEDLHVATHFHKVLLEMVAELAETFPECKETAKLHSALTGATGSLSTKQKLLDDWVVQYAPFVDAPDPLQDTQLLLACDKGLLNRAGRLNAKLLDGSLDAESVWGHLNRINMMARTEKYLPLPTKTRLRQMARVFFEKQLGGLGEITQLWNETPEAEKTVVNTHLKPENVLAMLPPDLQNQALGLQSLLMMSAQQGAGGQANLMGMMSQLQN